ncbi:MAG TPA: hypothetical protein VMK83_09605 [Gaiellaceae bacterium]|nr:hypothetical protein [Gaiellaceae bacterium]
MRSQRRNPANVFLWLLEPDEAREQLAQERLYSRARLDELERTRRDRVARDARSRRSESH